LKLIVTFVAGTLVDQLGRRPLLIGGTLGIVVAYVAVSIGFVTGATVVTICGLYSFICAYAVSMGPIGWVTVSEIFPTRIRGPAASLAVAVNRASSAMCTFCFLTVAGVLSPAGLFFVLASVNLGSAVFVYFLLPESKGKSLEEIERVFEADVEGDGDES